MRSGFYSAQPAEVTGSASDEHHHVMSYGDGDFKFSQCQGKYCCNIVVQLLIGILRGKGSPKEKSHTQRNTAWTFASINLEPIQQATQVMLSCSIKEIQISS